MYRFIQGGASNTIFYQTCVTLESKIDGSELFSKKKYGTPPRKDVFIITSLRKFEAKTKII